jgi:hypothetical protein
MSKCPPRPPPRGQWENLELDRNAMEGAVLTHNGKMYVALPESYEEYVTWHEAHHVARILNGAHGVPTDADEHDLLNNSFSHQYWF